jgi:hypothetical protein
MIYKNVKLYQVTYQNLDKLRHMIQINHGITMNKSQIMNLAVDNLIRVMASKIKSTTDDNK